MLELPVLIKYLYILSLQNFEEVVYKKNNFYNNISNLNMAPLWEVLSSFDTPEPNTRTHPHMVLERY